MIEIFSHGISVRGDDEAHEVFIISGFGWENEPFSLYVNKEQAKDLLWQLSFFVEDALFGSVIACVFCGLEDCDCGGI